MDRAESMTIEEVNNTVDELVAEIGYSSLVDGLINAMDPATRTEVLLALKTAYIA